MNRYTVISSDCHAGAALLEYRDYLDRKYHDDFDAWAATYVSPFQDLSAPEASRNWDDGVRNAALDEDGIAGEVVYPNTVPPFFSLNGLLTLIPDEDDYEYRLAGLRAHNRWLADFCARAPERRAGIGQIFLNNIADAVADIHWIADHMHPATISLFVLEASFYAHRPFWSLILAGVFDRYPKLRLVIAESGTQWIAPTLQALDRHHEKIRSGNIGSLPLDTANCTDHRPSEYWKTNCWVGASFMWREDCLDRHAIGVDRIMWGSDFPHDEGTYPHSREAIAHTFEGVPEAEVAQMVGGTAATLYNFDLDAIARHAVNGPTVSQVARGIDRIPDSTSLAFESRSWGVG
jgi:predicted TIM-barrel fold metal-dependent hydrolase